MSAKGGRPKGRVLGAKKGFSGVGIATAYEAAREPQRRCCKRTLAKSSLQRYLCGMTEDERFPRLETSRLKALAHPLRTQLLDALSAYGPATASALGERLGESSGATSYHLRQLEKAGFVREDPDRGSGRERWWERVPESITVDPTGLPRGSAERMASELVVHEWERTRRRRVDDFLRQGESVLPRDWVRASQISSLNMALTS